MRRSFVVLLVSVFFIVAASAQEKPRVFVTDSQSWEMSGSSGGTSGGFGGSVHGGARPQKAEIIKTFGEKCPQVMVNNIQEKADYVVLLDHEGGKGFIRKDNKVAVFRRDGDSIVSKSTRSLGSSVEVACGAIANDWPSHSSQAAAAAVTPAAEKVRENEDPKPAAAPERAAATLHISSEPLGADIELDGSFVGNTPSNIDVPAGEHTISIKKSGFKEWQRKIKTTSGSVNLAAQLEKASE